MAKITNEKEVTAEFIVAESRQMWAKCRAAFAGGLEFGDTDGANQLMADLRREHQEFCTSYPIVMRYMAEMQTFAPAALTKYLMKIAEHPWTNEDEYLESQADYVSILFRETNSRWDSKKVASVRNAVLDALKKERADLQSLADEVTDRVEENERRLKNRSRADLREWLIKNGGARSADAAAQQNNPTTESTTEPVTEPAAAKPVMPPLLDLAKSLRAD